MKPSDRMAICVQAIATLEWCNTVPHTIDRALSVLRETTHVRASVGATDGEGEGRRSKGSHSDPTAAAVQTISDAMKHCDEVTLEVDAALALLDGSTADIEGDTRTYRPGRTGQLNRTTLRLSMFDVDRSEWDDVLVIISDTAHWLGAQCYKMLAGAVQPPPVQVEQKKRHGCSSCLRFAIDTDVASGRYKHFCQRCGEFRTNHGCLPSEAICRMWDAGVNRVTPGMILEAKAATRRRSNRKAS